MLCVQEGSQCTADPVGDTLRAPGDLRQLKSLEANVEGEGEVQVKCEPEESVRWGAADAKDRADAVDRDDAVETGRHPESVCTYMLSLFFYSSIYVIIFSLLRGSEQTRDSLILINTLTCIVSTRSPKEMCEVALPITPQPPPP